MSVERDALDRANALIGQHADEMAKAVAGEREACARVAEEQYTSGECSPKCHQHLATAIRSRR